MNNGDDMFFEKLKDLFDNIYYLLVIAGSIGGSIGIHFISYRGRAGLGIFMFTSSFLIIIFFGMIWPRLRDL